MPGRPVDIARELGVSTATLRQYEISGIIPPVRRSANGYRVYTDEHMAYFICIREMLHGFSLAEISEMVKPVLAGKTDEALWIANKAQVSLHNDKYACEQIRQRFLTKKKPAVQKELSIVALCKTTGINPSTLRYWDKIGLISAGRCKANNYRTFTQSNIDEILMIQALKFAMRARGEKYAVEQIRREMRQFDFTDTDRLSALIAGIEKHMSDINRAQIRGISALYSLCKYVLADN